MTANQGFSWEGGDHASVAVFVVALVEVGEEQEDGAEEEDEEEDEQ